MAPCIVCLLAKMFGLCLRASLESLWEAKHIYPEACVYCNIEEEHPNS